MARAIASITPSVGRVVALLSRYACMKNDPFYMKKRGRFLAQALVPCAAQASPGFHPLLQFCQTPKFR